jgi:hypothetical protein
MRQEARAEPSRPEKRGAKSAAADVPADNRTQHDRPRVSIRDQVCDHTFVSWPMLGSPLLTCAVKKPQTHAGGNTESVDYEGLMRTLA